MASTTGASSTAHAVPMTTRPVACPAPLLTADFDRCSVPGGLELWQNWGYYSPGVCFIGYVALCTQTAAPSGGWPIGKDETAVRCVPIGYECNDKTSDQRYATSLYNDMTLSAPAFEIRWRSGDASGQFTQPPTIQPSTSQTATLRSTGRTESNTALPTPLAGSAGDMPAGKIAGIVLGAGAAICAVLAAVFAMHVRRKRVLTMVRLDAKVRKVQGELAELGSAGPAAELQAEGPVKELASNRPKQYDDYVPVNKEPAELPADPIFRSRH